MLSLLLSIMVALTHAAPSQNTPRAYPTTNLPPNLVRDTAAARKFAKTVSGPSEVLANWINPDVCNWVGFKCFKDNSTNHLFLYGVEFNELHLTGSPRLSGFIDKLLDISLIHLNGNHLDGEIPNLRNLTNLRELDLSNNRFSGEFPKNLLTAPTIQYLDLRFNRFVGELPNALFTAYPDIIVLFLNNNGFSGELPSTIGNTAAEFLTVAHNQLGGSIPKEMGDAKYLQQVLLLGNKFSGEIPTSLGKLSNLQVIDFSDNNLTGGVPEELCAIEKIKYINVAKNNLSKTLGPKCTLAKKKGILKM